MAFLGGLFKKKPGGSALGNLFRKVTNVASGGIVGNGAGIIGKEWDLNDDGKFSDAEMDNYKKNKNNPSVFSALGAGVGDAAAVTTAGDPASTPKVPLIDLNDFIKLPTVNTGLDQKTKSFVMIIAGFFGIMLLINLFKSRKR